jgi:lysophospholipase L1-like esterase
MRTVCFIGASTLEGMNDEAGLGWPGRLRALMGPDPHLTFHNLGIRGQTVASIAARWQAETTPRWTPGAPGLLVFSLGINDTARFDDGSPRVPRPETLAGVRRMMEQAVRRQRVLWVGPMPVLESKMPFYWIAMKQNLHYSNAALCEISGQYQEIAAEFGIPYLDLMADLAEDPVWLTALAQGDGLHPDGSGYQRVAERVARWADWRAACPRRTAG